MKTYLILILSFLSFLCFSQEFGRKATIWQHCYLEEFGGWPLIHDYIEVQSLQDTVVQNLQCHELVITHEPREFGTNKSIVVCNDNDKVYYLENDSLHLLYDFSLGKGDSYQVRYPTAFDTLYLYTYPNEKIYFNVQIDSVSYVTMNGQLLKKQHITVDNNGFSRILLGKYAMERFGYENWILPNWQCFVCERHIFEGLHSFNDSDISFQDPNSYCRLSAVNPLKRASRGIILIPNPAYDHLILESSDVFEIQNSHIYDLSGKSFPFESENDFNKIILHVHLNPGLYFLESRLANGVVVHTKFIIGE